MTHMKKSLLSIALFVCGLLLWKPVRAEAATQVDNLGLIVNSARRVIIPSRLILADIRKFTPVRNQNRTGP